MSRIHHVARGTAFTALTLAAALAVAPAAFATTGTPIADPDTGVNLATRVATLPATAQQLDLSASAGWLSTGNLAGNGDCRLERADPAPEETAALEETPAPEAGTENTDPAPEETAALEETPAPEAGTENTDPAPAEALEPAIGYNGTNFRVYSTLSITILKPGEYTFRVVDSTVAVEADHPFNDPYLALYSRFSTSDLDAGVVGCNDDGSLEGDYFPGYETKEYNELYPYFTSTLQPGTYTLVLMTYGPVTADAWNSGNLGPQSVTFEYWGPECGVEGGSCELAQTGVEPLGYLVASGALFLVGAGALVIARRRAAADVA
jgi:LPXTG-motif cell wall-anchored protein